MSPQRHADGVDELTRQVIDHAYAKYCAEQHMRPSAAAAQRFAVSVTESDAREYHGMRSAALVQMLAREFPGQGASHQQQ
jgi:hypothetical protein